jgi:hypothetical protein
MFVAVPSCLSTRIHLQVCVVLEKNVDDEGRTAEPFALVLPLVCPSVSCIRLHVVLVEFRNVYYYYFFFLVF